MRKKNEKNFIWLLYIESNIGGSILFDVVPCSSLKKARESLELGKNWILRSCFHYAIFTPEELKKKMVIEESKDRFYIKDPTDDYYEKISIVQKPIC